MAAARAQELRRLMKLQKAAGSAKKLNHPLAKYNNLDQIVCIVCDLIVKNEIMWTTHLQSRKHRENIVMLKTKSSKQADQSETVTKTKKDENLYTKKDVLPPDFFDPSVKNPLTASALQKPISSKQSSISQQSVAAEPLTNISTDSGELPNDFFDEGEKNKVENEPKEEKLENSNRKRKISNTESEKLPEGFFDDPKKDAKARNVEYKDPKEEEWEKFQQMIQEETKVSEAIQDEEDEEAEMMKDMQEYINLKSCLSRVDKLKDLVRKKKIENKKEIIPKTIVKEEISSTNKISTEDASDENEDEELQNLYNWRAKTL